MLRPVLFKLDRFPGKPGGSAASILNQGHLIEDAAPGAIVDDDDGFGWTFLQQATVAVAMAAAVATVGHAAQANDLANAWQDELPPQGYGWTAPASLDLWAQSSGRPRFVSFGIDELIVPQPATISVDEDYWQAPDPARRVLAFPPPVLDDDLPIAPLANYGSTGGTAPDLWSASTNRPRIVQLYADDVIVAQPVGGIALDDGTPPDGILLTVPSNVWMPVPWQFGGTEGSVWGPIDEVYEYRESAPRRALPCLPDAWSDEAIVPQLSPLHVDEVYWETPPSFVTMARGAIIVVDNPEIVPQPIPFALEEGSWEPGFVTPAMRWTAVSQWQDEVVATIHIDELAPDPWLLIPVQRVIVLPSPDEYDFALGGLNAGYPQSGINSISFDAMATVAVFDSLATSAVADSLTTTSAFDG